ncbi:hypothetical protein BO71DRAFT_338163, partial [Aspergillus ellipticus CBS 707.79]
VYAASKTEGERQAWRWIEENKPGFGFNAVLPCFNVKWYVDVEDVARLCIISLLDRSVQSERIFAFGGPAHWEDTIPFLRKLRPENSRIPDAPVGLPRDKTVIHGRGRAEGLLRGFYGREGFTGVQESLRVGVEGME